MGKVIFYGAISLDGYLADLKDQLDWLFQTGYRCRHDLWSIFATIDATVMGRKTYQEAKNLWMVDCCIPKRQTMFFPNTKRTVARCNASVNRSSGICFSIKTRGKRMGSRRFLIKTIAGSWFDRWMVYSNRAGVFRRRQATVWTGDYSRRLTFVETKQMGTDRTPFCPKVCVRQRVKSANDYSSQ